MTGDYPPTYTYYPHSPAHVGNELDMTYQKHKPTLTTNATTFLHKKYSLGGFTYIIKQVFPVFELVEIFRTKYGLVEFLSDVLTGLTVSTLLIPQSLSYATLAQLPPPFGLFTALFATFVYFLLGSAARVVSIGPFALSSLLTAQLINQMHPELAVMEETDPVQALHLRLVYTMTLTLVNGFYLILMAIFKLGWIIDLYSGPSLAAFLAGAGYAVGATQIGSLLGIKTEQGSFLVTMISLFKNIYKINFMTVFIGVSSLLIIYFSDKFSKKKGLRLPIPSQILLVIIWTILTGLFKLNEKFGVKVVGAIQMGYPTPVPPDLGLLFTNVEYWTNGLLLMASGFVVVSSISKTMGDKHHFEVNFNSELFSIGIASFLGSFINVYPSSAAYSRTVVVEACKPRSRLWGLTTCIVLLFVIFLCGPLLFYLPMAVLAAVVIASFINGYLDWDQGLRIGRKSFGEGCVFYATFFSTILISIQAGVIGALVASVVHYLLCHVSFTPVCLQQIPYTQRWVDYRTFLYSSSSTSQQQQNDGGLPTPQRNEFYEFVTDVENRGGVFKVDSLKTSQTKKFFDGLFSRKNKNNNNNNTTRNRHRPHGDLHGEGDSADYHGDAQYNQLQDFEENNGQLELGNTNNNDNNNNHNTAVTTGPNPYNQEGALDQRIIAVQIGGKLNHMNINPLSAWVNRVNTMFSQYKHLKERDALSFFHHSNEFTFPPLPQDDQHALVFAPQNLFSVYCPATTASNNNTNNNSTNNTSITNNSASPLTIAMDPLDYNALILEQQDHQKFQDQQREEKHLPLVAPPQPLLSPVLSRDDNDFGHHNVFGADLTLPAHVYHEHPFHSSNLAREHHSYHQHPHHTHRQQQHRVNTDVLFKHTEMVAYHKELQVQYYSSSMLPIPRNIDLTLLSPHQQHALCIMIRDTLLASVKKVTKTNPETNTTTTTNTYPKLLQYTAVILLDFVTILDITSAKGITDMIKQHPHILFLFTNPSQKLIEKFFVFDLPSPQKYVFDNVHIAAEYGKFILEIARQGRHYELVMEQINRKYEVQEDLP